MKRIAFLTAALLATTACTVHSPNNSAAADATPAAAGAQSGIDLAGMDKNV